MEIISKLLGHDGASLARLRVLGVYNPARRGHMSASTLPVLFRAATHARSLARTDRQTYTKTHTHTVASHNQAEIDGADASFQSWLVFLFSVVFLF